MWRSLFFSWLVCLLLLSPLAAEAQVVHQEFREQVRAEVLEVLDEYERPITGTDAVATVQEVRVIIKEGERAGEVVRFTHEFAPLQAQDKIFINRTVAIDGTEYIAYADYERRSTLLWLLGGFVLLLIILAGWQGVRALLSLAGSILAIFFLLIPALLAGYDPALVSVVIAGGILALVLFGTHGITPRSVIAFVGTFSAVVITGVIAFVTTTTMRLSGFSSDASVYLNFATNGSLDLAGLLLGSIIIGILGVLDDVSVTQASVVEQLKFANSGLQFKELYQRAIVVGRDHIGSLVNTLALAYVGVSLPLILLYARADSSLWQTLNQEVVAVEIVRILIGSIGLMLAVPATTAAAAWYFNDRVITKEPEQTPCAHAHGHSHDT